LPIALADLFVIGSLAVGKLVIGECGGRFSAAWRKPWRATRHARLVVVRERNELRPTGWINRSAPLPAAYPRNKPNGALASTDVAAQLARPEAQEMWTI